MKYADRFGVSLRGFTLSELLTVVAVIALLLAIITPGVGRVFAGARSISCKSNLNEIGKAYAMRVRDGQANPSRALISAYGWGNRFTVDYFGENSGVLRCPAAGHDDGAYANDYDASEENPWSVNSLPDVKIRVYNGSYRLYDLDTFTVYPFWNEADHRTYDRRTGLWKVNGDIYEGLDRYNMPKYSPGKNPREYWFVIEDQRTSSQDGNYGDAAGDEDFNDFDLHVKELGNGKVELTGFHKAAGYHFALVDEEGNEYGESGGTIGPVTLQGMWGLSYGMSTQVEDMQRVSSNAHKIIVVDYQDEAVSTGRWIGFDDGWSNLKAPRHMGNLNALHATGSVGTYNPDEVDPETSHGEVYWAPEQ
jgi:prepilin-type N-terminal cleavage/methylation domain-containing protein